MKLTVLGSGSANSNRVTTGFVLELLKQTIVIDLGFGCFKNMQSAGIDYSKVNNLFFTHCEHPDHINDLAAFLFARKGLTEKNQINLFAGKGLKNFVQNMFRLYPLFENLPFKLNVVELEAHSTNKFPNFSLITKKMKHMSSSLGFRFEANGKSVVFSGDTEQNENLVDLAKNADLFVAECNFGEKKGEDHMNAEQVASIAARANAKELLLHHFSPEAEKADTKALAAKKFKGKIYVAKDLMQVNV